MRVHFNDSTISDGHVTATTSSASDSQIWQAHFKGNFAGNSVTLIPDASQPGGAFTVNETTNAGTTSFGGAFTGEAAGGFVGAFEMIDAADSQNFIQGAFTLGKGASLNDL